MHESSTERVLARYLLAPSVRRKVAATLPPVEEGELSSAGTRNIPKNHEFQARALKPLAKALWASTVALGHTLTAYRHLSRLKSATVSPDGLMGGRGYVMKLAEMRQKLYEASEALSAISDTIFDEINAPHWKPKLAQLDESDQEDVTRFVEEAQEVMENPEGEAEEEIEEIEGKSDKDEKKSEPDPDKGASGLPIADAAQAESPARATETRTKEASTNARPAGLTDRQWIVEFYSDSTREGYVAPVASDPVQLTQAIYVKANSSLPVSELPGGPRVDHIGPGTGSGEYGEFDEGDASAPPDDWSADGGGISRRDDSGEDYDYPSQWENDLSRSACDWKAPSRDTEQASASIPDSSTDDTPTSAWDFGIGYGARGQGAGGYANPSGEGNGTKGVWGPQSGLPGTPSQSSGDTTRVVVDEKLNRYAFDALYSRLPQDDAGDVARSDYYSGAKDNLVSVGTSEMPTPDDQRSVSGQPLVNTYYTAEDTATPYERYDYSTHTLREPGGDYPGQDHQEPFAPDGEGTR